MDFVSKKEYMRNYMKKYRANKKEFNMCLECKEPATFTVYCEKHYFGHLAAQARWRAMRKTVK